MTALVWPFKQRAELLESLEWLTEVMRAKSSEDRRALRMVPRRTLHLSHLMSAEQHAAARALIRSTDLFRVPDWTQSARVGNVAAGSSVVVSFDPTGMRIAGGDEALLWQDDARWEVVTLSSVTGNGATLATVAADRVDARLLPLREGFAPEGLAVQRPAGRWRVGEIPMRLLDNADAPASAYPQYRGLDVLTDCPVAGADTLEESIIWPADVLDNEMGVPQMIRERTLPDVSGALRWLCRTRADLLPVRQWLDARRGRLVAFWGSSWGADYVPASTISSGSTTLTVFAPGGVASLGRDEFDIEIRRTTGASLYRHVDAVAVGTPVDGRATLDLTLDAAPGVTLTPDAIRRVSDLRCLRLAADRVEILHRAGEGAWVSVPVIEIPEPEAAS